MTTPAEPITIEIQDEDGVWAPCSREAFAGNGEAWTPARLMEWYASTASPQRGLARLLGIDRSPIGISTALGPCSMRYAVRGGLLFPKWAALSRLEEDALSARVLPDDWRLELRESAIFVHFAASEPLTLTEPLGLVRCNETPDGLHWWVNPKDRFTRKAERYLPVAEGMV